MILICLIIDGVHFDYSIKVLSPGLYHCKVTFFFFFYFLTFVIHVYFMWWYSETI